jgi:hypothetical protein
VGVVAEQRGGSGWGRHCGPGDAELGERVAGVPPFPRLWHAARYPVWTSDIVRLNHGTGSLLGRKMTRCRRTLKQTRFNCCVQTEFRGKRASNLAERLDRSWFNCRCGAQQGHATVCSFYLAGIGMLVQVCAARAPQTAGNATGISGGTPFSLLRERRAPHRHVTAVSSHQARARAPRHGPRATAPEPRACRPISDVSIYPLTSPHPPPNPRGHDPLLHQSTATAHRESATDIRAPASLSLPTVPPQATRRSHAGRGKWPRPRLPRRGVEQPCCCCSRWRWRCGPPAPARAATATSRPCSTSATPTRTRAACHRSSAPHRRPTAGPSSACPPAATAMAASSSTSSVRARSYTRPLNPPPWTRSRSARGVFTVHLFTCPPMAMAMIALRVGPIDRHTQNRLHLPGPMNAQR